MRQCPNQILSYMRIKYHNIKNIDTIDSDSEERERDYRHFKTIDYQPSLINLITVINHKTASKYSSSEQGFMTNSPGRFTPVLPTLYDSFTSNFSASHSQSLKQSSPITYHINIPKQGFNKKLTTFNKLQGLKIKKLYPQLHTQVFVINYCRK